MQKSLHRIIIVLTLGIFVIVAFSCGDDNLIISESKYQPKIVIEGLIYPGYRVEDIRITRNYPVDQDINVKDFYLEDAHVTITDMESGVTYQLIYDSYESSFHYSGRELRIGFAKNYRLDVTAEIEGKTLSASSTTTTPNYGFSVISMPQSLKYREKDSSGVIKQFYVTFKPSDGASIYVFYIRAAHPNMSNFIYDNSYFGLDTAYVYENFATFSNRYAWTINLDSDNEYSYDLAWINFWFYDSYDITVYAGDKNYHNFIATYANIQEADGNFHEPSFNIEGDGIGYFGSAIRGHTGMEVLK